MSPPRSEPLRVLVVDDEPLARDNIRIGLRTDPDVAIVGECGDGRQAVALIRELAPDLVFLDIQMPGFGGFGVIEEVGVERMPAVVFVTAFDTHAIRAFEVRAIHYLLKPFDDARLRESVRRARAALESSAEGTTARLRELVELARSARLGSGPGPLARFVVKDGDRAVPVRAEDVDWIGAAGNYVVLHVRNQTHRLRASLRTLSDQLDRRQFARVHKSTIVNLDRIREIQPWFGGDYVAILHSGEKLRVSRSFAAELLRPLQ